MRRRAPFQLHDVLREARERLGVSQRELARRVGVSWVTINQAEQGRDVRHSTLRAYARAFPDLRVTDLFAPRPGRASATPASTWELYRALYGFEAAEISKTVHVRVNGDADTILETRGLRSLKGDMTDFSIVVGLQRAVFHGAPGVLKSIEASNADLTMRLVEKREGHAIHQFRFPKEMAKDGISYKRRILTSRLFRYMTAQQAQRDGLEGDHWAGSSTKIDAPVRLLTMTVSFPGRYWPRTFRAFVWPAVQVPDADVPDLSGRLLRRGERLQVARDEATVRLRVERPLVGFKYGIGWILP